MSTNEQARDVVAKAIADVIGHGMREKCERHADAALAAIATLRQPDSGRVDGAALLQIARDVGLREVMFNVSAVRAAPLLQAFFAAALAAQGQLNSGYVGEGIMNRVLDMQPLAGKNDGRRLWQIMEAAGVEDPRAAIEAALAAQGEGEATLAGYVDPEQVADMQRNGGGVSIGTFSERYGRTVPVYWCHAKPAPPRWVLEALAAAPSTPEGDGGYTAGPVSDGGMDPRNASAREGDGDTA